MTKNKIPKVKDKKELQDWVRSVGRKNVDKKELKDAYKKLKKDK